MASWFAMALSVFLTSYTLLVSAGDIKEMARNFTANFRPPSVPLVVVDPYLSVWSNGDHLYDDCPHHWSGPAVCLSGMIRIDGKAYRFMANSSDLAPNTMKQINITVFPTQTLYIFEEAGVQLTLLFTTPAYGPYLASYPLTYLTYSVTSIDGKDHSVQIYYDNTAEGAVASVSEAVVWSRIAIPGHITMRIGTKAQQYFSQTSDKINWGYWYVDVLNNSNVTTTMAYSTTARTAFMSGQPLPPDDKDQPRPCNDHWPALVVVWNLGTLHHGETLSKYLIIAYDQVYSIKYFGTAMIPLWKFKGNITNLLTDPYIPMLRSILTNIDNTIVTALHVTGGSNYTTISSLAWRQTTGATLAVYNNVTSQPWMFMKGISTNGTVSPMDIIYAASPLILWSSNKLFPVTQMMMLPILDYANNATAKYGVNVPYNLSWTPHYLGHWPICDTLPNKQKQMPMEETGNMMLMLAYVVKRDGDMSFLEPYWPLLSTWGKYLAASLPDPTNQFCADDFEGPSAHNVNLAAKGIVGLAAYAYLLRTHGQTAEADHYDSLNKDFVHFWLTNASDGDHYKRQYNNTNSWSLKYNLVFQKALGFDLFPNSTFSTEEKYYQKMMQEFGVPLDERADFTLAHWEMFVAGMANQQQFQITIDKIYKYLNETPDRVPFSDWYFTSTGRQKGFRARPVVGGLLTRVLLTHPLNLDEPQNSMTHFDQKTVYKQMD